MITLTLTQGTPAWHAHRRNHFNASDAPAMMGVSKYKTRTELLHEIATGITPEVDESTQRRFDEGHQFEALARPLAELIVGESLSPVVGTEGRLSASFDGITFNEDELVIWEHKTFNCGLKDVTDSHQLPEQYHAQMEQQLMVSGASKCLFMATKWDGDEITKNMHVWYESSQAMRDRLLAGWKQFDIDLTEYKRKLAAGKIEPAKEAPIADAIASLPALFVQSKGEIIDSNMTLFGESLAISLAQTRSIVLTADQDYANASAAAKMYRATCKKLEAVKEAILSQATTIGEATQLIDTWHEDLRVTALQLEKSVTKEKEAKKLAIVADAQAKYANHITELGASIRPVTLIIGMPDFASAIKGKSLISAWQNSANVLLANSIIAADQHCSDIRVKLDLYNIESDGYAFLFNDLQHIIVKPIGDFKLLITSRIAAHKVAEVRKLGTELERIRKEKRVSRISEELAKNRTARLENEKTAIYADAGIEPISTISEYHRNDTKITYHADISEYDAAQLIRILICECEISHGTACDWILRAADEMRESA